MNETQNASGPLVGVAEAAQLCGVDRSTITRWVRSGHLAPVHRGPGRTGAMVFDRDQVRQLASARRP